MKKRKILVLFPVLALVLSGCTIQEGLAGAKSFIGNNVYFPLRNFVAGLLGKSVVDPTKTDDQQGQDSKTDDQGKEDEGKEDEGKEDDKPVIPETVHAGTEADPLDGADAMTIANALKGGQVTTDSYYIKDKVTKIVKAWEEKYGSYSFEIDGGFIGWQLYYGADKAKFAENDIEVGDTVTMYAQIQMYGSENPTPETKGGYVTKVEKAALDATLTSIEIGGTAKTEYIEGQDYSAEGLTVTANYDGADSRDVTKGVSWSFSKAKAELEDKSLTITATYSEGGVEKTDSKQVAVNVTAKQDPVHAGTAEDPFDAADVLKVTAGFKSGDKTDKAYYVKGEVKSFATAFNAEYGDYSFYIEENIEGFSMKNGPEREAFTGGELEVGDTVTMYGTILNYNGKIELNGRSDGDAYIVEIVKGEGGGDITPTALTKKVTFEMGDDGDASHNDGTSNTAYTETVDDVVLNIKDGTGLGVGARDAKGNGCLKVGTSKAAGSFTLDLTTVTGLDKVVLNIANYKANTGATIVVGDADGVDITGTSDAGVYDAFPINIKDETSLSFSFPKRVMINSIEFWPEEKVVDVESVTINEAGPFTLNRYSENPTKQLSATVLPNDATSKTVTWSVELDENVTEGAITVDSESGLVTGVSKGSGTVYATAGGVKSAGAKFTVVQHLTAFSVTPASQNLTVGDTLTLTKVFTPENADVLDVTFVSSNPEVASVSSAGVITAVAAGTATITATASDFATPATCTVTVQNAAIHINGVVIDTENPLALYIGDETDLEAHVMPQDTTDTDQEVVWEVVNNQAGAIQLTSAGHVTALAEGTATVKAKSHLDSNIESADVLTINVSKVGVTGVKLQENEVDISEKEVFVGAEFDLTAVVSPDNATNKAVQWASDDTDVATVSNGHVIAVGAGTANITATSVDNNQKAGSLELTVNAVENIELTAASLELAGYGDGSNSMFSWSQLCKETTTQSIQGNSSRSPASEIHNTSAFGADINHIELIVGKVSGSSATATITFGTEAEPTENSVTIGSGTTYSLTALGRLVIDAPAGCRYFKLAWSNGASYYSSIKVCFDELAPITPTEVTITSSAQLMVGNDLELTAEVGPTGAAQDVEWSIVTGNSYATLVGSTLTGVADGNVTVRATATGHNDVYDEMEISVYSPSSSTTTINFKINEYCPANNITGGSKVSSMALDANVTATASGTDGNTGKVYQSTQDTSLWEWRFYGTGNGTLTITVASGYVLDSVVIGKATSNYGSPSDFSMTVANNQAVYSPGSNFNVKTIVVTYHAA